MNAAVTAPRSIAQSIQENVPKRAIRKRRRFRVKQLARRIY